MLAAISAGKTNRGNIETGYNTFADQLRNARFGPLSEQEGVTADDIRDAYDRGEQVVRQVAQKNGIKKSSYATDYNSAENSAMIDLDLASLLAAAIAEPRPQISARKEVPTGSSPVDQALAGYFMATNLVIEAAELDCDLNWRHRQSIYAAEIARLQAEGGTADPAVIDSLKTAMEHCVLSERHCTNVKEIARASNERVVEIMAALHADLPQLNAAPTHLREAGTQEIFKRLAVAVDQINAQTQRLIDQHCPGATVAEFLAARNLDTTVPAP